MSAFLKNTCLIAGLTLLPITALTTTTMAAGDAATERQSLMKNVGAATGTMAKMVKGEIPFDAIAAQMALKTMHSAALGFGYMFPEGSESGANTEASPKIWSDRAGFDKMVNKFVADSAASASDLGELKQAFGGIAANCGACHKAYRVKN